MKNVGLKINLLLSELEEAACKCSASRFCPTHGKVKEIKRLLQVYLKEMIALAEEIK